MVNKERINISDKTFSICINTLMVILSIVFLYPLWMTLVQSMSSPQYADSLGFKLWPKEISWSAYHVVLSRSSIIDGYMNTIWRTVITTLTAMFVTYLGAFALSRHDMPGKTAITLFVVFTMFFSGGLVPSYLLIKDLGLLGSRWALVFPGLCSAWNLVIARNFIQSLPAELEEAANIDGAHPLTVVFKIMLPLSGPILAVLGLWVAVGQWNAWFDAMLYCSQPGKKVLALVVREMVIESQNDMMNSIMVDEATTSSSVRASTIILSTLPILCLYPFLQKYFVKGVMVGALKG